MDKEILDILKDLKEGQNDIVKRLDKIENKLDGVVEQTADLLEFRSDITEKVEAIRKDIGKVEVVTSKNCFEIEYLKAVK